VNELLTSTTKRTGLLQLCVELTYSFLQRATALLSTEIGKCHTDL